MEFLYGCQSEINLLREKILRLEEIVVAQESFRVVQDRIILYLETELQKRDSAQKDDDSNPKK